MISFYVASLICCLATAKFFYHECTCSKASVLTRSVHRHLFHDVPYLLQRKLLLSRVDVCEHDLQWIYLFRKSRFEICKLFFAGQNFGRRKVTLTRPFKSLISIYYLRLLYMNLLQILMYIYLKNKWAFTQANFARKISYLAAGD